jgi:hypothetical protein
MDPYIEAQGQWESFHTALITHSAESLNQRLPDGYVAKIEARVALVSLDLDRIDRIPDVLVGRDAGTASQTPSAEAPGVAILEPITIPLARSEVEVRERWIEILKSPELELATVIEFLSPTNKVGGRRGDYLEKRDSFIDQPVNLVEIDLLLSGRHMPMKGVMPRGDYHAIVARAERRPNAEVYSWSLRDPLPLLPVPLRFPDADVMLDLGEVFRLTYDRGRFRQILRYGETLPTSFPIAPEDLIWAESLVR